MGRNTWDSLPIRPLPDRLNFVVSKTIKAKDVFSSLEKAILNFETELTWFDASDECFIIGGAKIYEYALANNLVDRILISRIPGTHKADTFFPTLGEEWVGKKLEQHDSFDVWEYVKAKK